MRLSARRIKINQSFFLYPLSSFRPARFDIDGGVFALDENLLPVRRLIETKPDGGKYHLKATALKQSEERFAVTYLIRNAGAFFEVFDRAGKRIQRVSIDPMSGRANQPGRFIRLGDGFLFADRKLTWLADDAGTAPQIFGPPTEATISSSLTRSYYFGIPRVIGTKLYVTGQDGHLFIFSVDQFSQ